MNRRQILQLSSMAGTGLLLNSCGLLTQYSANVGDATEGFNQRIQELMLNPQALAPEYPKSAIEPKQLLINSFNGTPKIDIDTFKLTIDGEVNLPMQLSMQEVKKLPLNSLVMRHVCVEGWAAIVQWGGVRLRDLIALAQPKNTVKYVYFKSEDGYYESWDIASVLHPQTLLAYQMNGDAIPAANGAPLRLSAPIKLGYKQSKWVSKVTLLSQLPQKRGYWEDEGYEWFGGL
jgi:DMSO/TMAO reductase YedYZ molybdopterin-dependent catalytic subunit